MGAVLLCAWAVSAALYAPMQPPFAPIIADGRPIAEIATDPFPPGDGNPAELLNEYLEKISGCRLPIVQRPSGRRYAIFIGPRCGLARLGRRVRLGDEGFVIAADQRRLILAGPTQLATCYAVAAFLEECLGVRWFWHGEGGEFVPQSKTIRVGRYFSVQRPAFSFRWVGRGRWAMLNRQNVNVGVPGQFKVQWFVHTFLNLVPPEKYWPAHPEYYALRGGKRQDPRNRSRQVQLCTSNPEVAEAAARTIDELLRRDPEIRMVSVDPMDSQNFCQCPACKALDEPGAPYPRRHTRRLILFYNRVAELVSRRHPKLLIKSIAYHSYAAPPADPKIRVRDNVVIQLCHFQCHNHTFADRTCPFNRQYDAYLRGWLRIAKHVALYEYYWKVSWLNLPWPIVHALRRDLPYLHRLGVMGVASQWTTNFASNGLAYYVAAKLLWNPRLDVDALLEDFYAKAYGPAAGPMKRFHERLERAAIDSGVHLAGQRPYADVLRVFTPEVLRELDELIRQAIAQAGDGPAAGRVRMMARGLEYTHLVVDYLRTIKQAAGLPDEAPWPVSVPADRLRRVRELAGPKAEAIRKFLQDPQNHTAVGGMNSYLKLLLRPDYVATNWRTAPDMPEGTIALTKPQWLRLHRQKPPWPLPQSFELWVYGNDLDFVAGKPEHSIYAIASGGRRVLIGRVGTADRPGDGLNRCYILSPIPRSLLSKGRLRLVITNDPGGPYGSRFYALYLMPPTGLQPEAAEAKIFSDLQWVRSRALAFVEFGPSGLQSADGDQDEVAIEVPGAQ